MDSIDVEIDSFTSEDGEEYRHVALVLNGTKVPGTFDEYSLFISTLNRLTRTEILTCSCGCPGCAGIDYGTVIKLRRNTVEWRDIDSGLPKRFYSFDKSEYLRAVDKTTDLLKEICRFNKNLRRGDDWYDRIRLVDESNVDDALAWYTKNWAWYKRPENAKSY